MPSAGSSKRGFPFVSGVLMAAGASQRLGRTKQLLRFRGETLLRRAAREALSSRLAELVVVLGHEAERLRPELAGLNVRIVENADYAQGMSSSLRAGLEAISPQAEAALFLVSDQPRAEASLIDRILTAYAEARPDAEAKPDAVVPVAGSRPGNPVLVDRRHFPALMALRGDVGGRPVVRALGERVLRLPVDEALLEDVDEPSDVDRLSEG